MTVTYDLPLVLLSIFIGVVAAYGTFASARLIALVDRRTAPFWVAGGGVTMGAGIWTLHFIAMLAFRTEVPVQYAPGETLVSLGIAVVASAIALLLLWWYPALKGVRVLAGLVIGAGIAAMHYTGMSAIEMDAALSHRTGYMVASIVWGMGFSWLALVVAYPAERLAAGALPTPLRVPAAALILGGAVGGLHYIGMAGLELQHVPGVAESEPIDRTLLAILATVGMLLVISVMLGFGATHHWQRSRVMLAERDRMLRNLVAHLPAMVFQIDGQRPGAVNYLSDGAVDVTGYPAEAFLNGQVRLDDLIVGATRDDLVEERLRAGAGSYSVDYQLRRRDGIVRWIRERGTVTRDSAGKRIVEGFAEDVTERKEMEERLRQHASYDYLTGALNRFRLETLLDEEMKRSRRLRYPLSVLMLDVDYFKQINDQYGHDTGDQVLREVAEVIRGRIRETDRLARWGGEEFVLALPGTVSADAAQLAEALRGELESQRFAGALCITVSVGVAEYRDGDSLRALTIRADQAMYMAKDQGRNAVVAL